MTHPTGPKQIASIVWAVLIGGGVVVLAGSILLPSTKRARIDFDRFRPGPADTQPASAAVDR